MAGGPARARRRFRGNDMPDGAAAERATWQRRISDELAMIGPGAIAICARASSRTRRSIGSPAVTTS